MKKLLQKVSALLVASMALTACVEETTYYQPQVGHTRAYYTGTYAAQDRYQDTTYYSTPTPPAPPRVVHVPQPPRAPDTRYYSTQTPPAPVAVNHAPAAPEEAPVLPPTGNGYASTATPAAPPL